MAGVAHVDDADLFRLVSLQIRKARHGEGRDVGDDLTMRAREDQILCLIVIQTAGCVDVH